jgi:hypothetical protein
MKIYLISFCGMSTYGQHEYRFLNEVQYVESLKTGASIEVIETFTPSDLEHLYRQLSDYLGYKRPQ